MGKNIMTIKRFDGSEGTSVHVQTRYGGLNNQFKIPEAVALLRRLEVRAGEYIDIIDGKGTIHATRQLALVYLEGLKR